jgi:branched-chain amino acid transport system ATP-binding protein
MLCIKELYSGFGGSPIIRGIDIEVKPGEIVAIIGPNGSGKSTVLKSIFNLCEIYSGKIIWKNKDITKLKTYNKISEGISYVPQGKQIFKDLTVHENLEIGAFIMPDKLLVKQKIEDVYEKFPFLKRKEKKHADTLSGGQQQMLAIGRALIQNPQLLLLDEPTIGLSPKAMKEIFKKIQEINKEGVSIIIIEHNVNSVIGIADRTYILEDGKIALTGGKEILNNSKIKNIYFGGR